MNKRIQKKKEKKINEFYTKLSEFNKINLFKFLKRQKIDINEFNVLLETELPDFLI